MLVSGMVNSLKWMEMMDGWIFGDFQPFPIGKELVKIIQLIANHK